MNFWKMFRIVGPILLLAAMAVAYIISSGSQPGSRPTQSAPQGQGLRLN